MNRIAASQAVLGQEVVGPAACFLDQQQRRERIPGIDVELAIGVGPPVRDIGDAEGAGARAADIDARVLQLIDKRRIGRDGNRDDQPASTVAWLISAIPLTRMVSPLRVAP